MKKFLIFWSFIAIFLAQPAFSKDIPVLLSPEVTLSTTSDVPQEGDIIKFKVKQTVTYKNLTINKNAVASGMLASREENDYYGKVASLYIDQLRVCGSNGESIKLKGVILKKGNDHPNLSDWGFFLIRGGEAFLRPKKDIFTVFLEVN
ncbi:MAG: hypothetical protein PHV37_10090 [Candidatus Gastranaerophilales bacterium]|nr:hypothetical protein [Candidatus Gastranaerophilales bacterium]